MTRTNLTILDPVAYAEHLAQRNREATAELEAILEAQPIITDLPQSAPSTRALPDWLSFVVVAAAASVGLFAGIALSGGLI